MFNLDQKATLMGGTQPVRRRNWYDMAPTPGPENPGMGLHPLGYGGSPTVLPSSAPAGGAVQPIPRGAPGPDHPGVAGAVQPVSQGAPLPDQQRGLGAIPQGPQGIWLPNRQRAPGGLQSMLRAYLLMRRRRVPGGML